MLVITRDAGQGVHIGDDIYVKVIEVKGGKVRLGILAPSEVELWRDEVYRVIQKKKQELANRTG